MQDYYLLKFIFIHQIKVLMKFNKHTQTEVFRILVKEWDRIYNNEQNELPFQILQNIWSTKGDASEEILQDALQHYFRNNDWSSEDLFITKFKIYENDRLFQGFVENILSPEHFSSSDELTTLSIRIDDELAKSKLKLVTTDFNSLGLPIQHIEEITPENDLPPGVKKNNIPFYVINDKESLSKPETKYFSLEPNKGWNDYGIVSGFTLYYHDKPGAAKNIGYLKLINEQESVTWEHLPKRFIQLGEDFCSLSNDEDYYLRLKNIFGENGLISTLYALQDAAYFPEINDRYEHNSNFSHSLLRDNSANRMLRNVKALLKGQDLGSMHSFDYRFKPAYATAHTKVSFHFDDNQPLPNRIIAIIGKNGTGKTQLVTAIPLSFANNAKEDFYDAIPSFTKIIAVSYSVFDTFKIPRRNATFNYVYCGLKDDSGELRTDRGLTLSFHNNWKKIDDMRRTEQWRKVLLNFLDEELVNTLITVSDSRERDYEVSLEGFHLIKKKLSSGQSILLYIITQVVANIRVDSLIIYDEPETHLHPNAIVELMNTIYELVNQFEAYCLIATHSPIIIRELQSKNVFIIDRENSMPMVRRIRIESFGENLGILSDEVFGDREMPKQYKKIINELIKKGLSFENIVSALEYDEVPLSLNARIYIGIEINNQNEEF
jgi:predicted ATPase